MQCYPEISYIIINNIHFLWTKPSGSGEFLQSFAIWAEGTLGIKKTPRFICRTDYVNMKMNLSYFFKGINKMWLVFTCQNAELTHPSYGITAAKLESWNLD